MSKKTKEWERHKGESKRNKHTARYKVQTKWDIPIQGELVYVGRNVLLYKF